MILVQPLLAELTKSESETIIYAGTALSVLVVAAIMWYALKQWQKVRSKLDETPDATVERGKPGVFVEQLSAVKWDRVFVPTLRRAGASLTAEAAPVAVKTATALTMAAELGALSTAIRSALVTAERTGDLQTVLVKDDRCVVYALAVPDRHIHARMLRRFDSLAEGWLEHAAKMHRSVANGRSRDLLCLLYFLGPDARDGTLAVAYETDDSRLATAELVEGDTSDGRPLHRTATWGFQLE